MSFPRFVKAFLSEEGSGVFPDREVKAPGADRESQGGNPDVRNIRPGTRTLTPCYYKDGLPYDSDVHACRATRASAARQPKPGASAFSRWDG